LSRGELSMKDSEAHHLLHSQPNKIFSTLQDRGISPAGFHLEHIVIGEHKAVRLAQTATNYHFAITILRFKDTRTLAIS
jgi:hypothetical protein